MPKPRRQSTKSGVRGKLQSSEWNRDISIGSLRYLIAFSRCIFSKMGKCHIRSGHEVRRSRDLQIGVSTSSKLVLLLRQSLSYKQHPEGITLSTSSSLRMPKLFNVIREDLKKEPRLGGGMTVSLVPLQLQHPSEASHPDPGLPPQHTDAAYQRTNR